MPDITGRKNPEIQYLRRLIRDGAFRRSEQVFICHGTQSLIEARKSRAEVLKVYGVKKPDAEFCAPFVSVTPEVLEAISDVVTTEDAVFTVKMPRPKKLSGRKLIALEDVRDPGNVGTVIRTADAFGMDGVVFLGSCADPFAPKTVRSTAGSHFRVPFFFSDLTELSAYCKKENVPLYAAALDKCAQTLSQGSVKEGCVMIGNEARGLSDAAKKDADGMLFIPIKSAESLNAAVAAAIFMWEMSGKK